MNVMYRLEDSLFFPIPMERYHGSSSFTTTNESSSLNDSSPLMMKKSMQCPAETTTPLVATPTSIKNAFQFHPIECSSSRGVLLQDILDSSEDIFPSDTILATTKDKRLDEVLSGLVSDESELSFLPLFATTTAEERCKSSCVVAEEEEEEDELATITELEDPPITCRGDQLPVAAALLKHVDLFLPLSGRKHGREESSSSFSQQESSDEEKSSEGRFSPLEDQWTERFHELCEYKEQVGHCSVPHNYKENPRLARWVKRQRHQYKIYKDEEIRHRPLPSAIKERMDALDSIGFVWDCQGVAWDEKFMELMEYRDKFLDCNVPTCYPPNQPLAMWVKCQRRQYKMYMEGMKSGMTPERAQQLESIGFTWEIRKHKKARRC